MSNLCNNINNYKNQISKTLPNLLNNNTDITTIINTIINSLNVSTSDKNTALSNLNLNIKTICSNSDTTLQSNSIDCVKCQNALGCGHKKIINLPECQSNPSTCKFGLDPNYENILVSNYGSNFANNYLNYLNTVCTCSNNIQNNSNNNIQSCTFNNLINSLNLNTFNPIITALYLALNDFKNNTNVVFDCSKIPSNITINQYSNILQACVNKSQNIQQNLITCASNVNQVNLNELTQSCVLSSQNSNSQTEASTNSNPTTPAQKFCNTSSNILKNIPNNWTDNLQNKPLINGISNLLNIPNDSITNNLTSTSLNVVQQTCNNTSVVNQLNSADNTQCYEALNCNQDPTQIVWPDGISNNLKISILQTNESMCMAVNSNPTYQKNISNVSQNCVINNTVNIESGIIPKYLYINFNTTKSANPIIDTIIIRIYEVYFLR